MASEGPPIRPPNDAEHKPAQGDSTFAFYRFLEQALSVGARGIRRSALPTFIGYLVYIALAALLFAGILLDRPQVTAAAIVLLLIVGLLTILLLFDLPKKVRPIVAEIILILVAVCILGVSAYAVFKLLNPTATDKTPASAKPQLDKLVPNTGTADTTSRTGADTTGSPTSGADTNKNKQKPARDNAIVIRPDMTATQSPPITLHTRELESLETQRMDVVKLRSQSDSSTETASGVYVGQDEQNAYFITAFHPLKKHAGANDPYEPVETVELQFYSRPVGMKALVLDHYDPVFDLAVVYIPVNKLPAEMVFMPRTEASAGVPIHIIGHPPAGDWTAWAGVIQNELNVGGDSNFFSTGSDSSLTKGYSGAPVLDSNGGFVGIHLSSSNSYAKNLKSDAIVKSLREWRVPITNLAGSGAGLVGTWRGPNGKPFFIHGNDSVAIPDRADFDLPNGSSWTLEAWVYPTEDPRGKHVVGKRDGCNGGGGFYQISINDDNPGMSIDPQYTPLNTWTHVAIVGNGSEGWSSFANGVVVKTVSSPGWRIRNSGRFLIGGSGTCTLFIGAIDQVSLYARALSEAEIRSTYTSQSSEVLRNRIEH
jgi:hypothetical protein